MSNLFFYEPFYDIERFFDEMLSGSRQDKGNVPRRISRNNVQDSVERPLKPRMNLLEDTEKNIVTATFEFPGLTKDDIQINVQNGRLIVSGETTGSSEHDEHGYAVRERHYGKFSRTLQLPQGVKEGEIKASMNDGLLTVTFPQMAADIAPKKIVIA